MDDNVAKHEGQQPDDLRCQRGVGCRQDPRAGVHDQSRGTEHHHRANRGDAQPQPRPAIPWERVGGDWLLGRFRRLRPLHRLGRLPNAAEHATEDDLVERDDRIPVENPDQPPRPVEGRHLEFRRGFGRTVGRQDLELELRLPGQFHLRPEREKSVAINADHPPEIERLAKLDVFRMPPATAQPRATDKRVHPAPQSPQHVAGIPAVPPANSTDGGEHTLWIGVDFHRSPVGEDGATSPRRVARDRAGHAPPRLHRPGLDLPQRPRDRLPSPERRVRHEPLSIVIGEHDPVSQALGQGPCDPIRHRRDDVDPQGAQSRREHRHRHDEPPR